MPRRPPTRCRASGWGGSVGGLLLVLAFVVHDLAMAGGMHAAPEPGIAARRTVVAASVAPSDAVPADRDGGCFVVRPAAPCGDDDPAVPPAAGSPPTLTPLPDALLTLPLPVWAEPTAPPGTRRALVQAYRI